MVTQLSSQQGDSLLRRSVPTLIHDGKAWVSASDYDSTYKAFEDWMKVAGDRAGEVERLREERDEARAQAQGYRDALNAANPLASGGPDLLPWETAALGREEPSA